MSIPGITANLTTQHFKINSEEVYVKNSSENPGLLLIHASWCGHCKRFISTYQSLCQRLNKNGSSDFPCVAIEDSELKGDGGKLSSALNVSGYPTLKFFDQHGKIVGDYQGGRDEDALLKSICNVYHHCVTKH
jgi:thiol-disulfide isomerase/thioredoxin